MLRATKRESQMATLNGNGPLGGEELVEYNVFLTDGFGRPGGMNVSFFETEGSPEAIDGYSNDDAYRASRHYSRRADFGENSVSQEYLRESSLARQLQGKKDQIATIRLMRRVRKEEVKANGVNDQGYPFVNIIPPSTKFMLQAVQENREEKVQVVDTFGEWVAFFFGRRPEVYAYSGILLNSKNHDWKNEFQMNYEYFLRGSKAVEYRALMYLQYEDVLIEGYMMNCNITQTAQDPHAVGFNFNLLVTNRSPLNPRRMIALRFARSGGTAEEELLFNTMQAALSLVDPVTGKPAENKVQDMQTYLLVREYFGGQYVPAAGVIQHFLSTNKVSSDASAAPGSTSGIEADELESGPVETPYKDLLGVGDTYKNLLVPPGSTDPDALE